MSAATGGSSLLSGISLAATTTLAPYCVNFHNQTNMVDFTQETHQPGLTMKYMYTTTPDEGCREFSKGIYGRPVHTSHQSILRKRGWAYSINDIEVTHVREEKEGREEEAEVDDERDVWVALYEEKFGKKPHHKTKLDTIIAKVEGDAD